MFVGIDPGKSGGIAVLGVHPADIETFTFKSMTDKDIWLVLAKCEPADCVLEKVGATPQMGVVSAFKFGDSYGGLRMATIAAGLRLAIVTPQKWQREFGLIVTGRGLGRSATDKKNRNKAKAQELFPSVKITHGNADALLLAEYCRRTVTALELATS